MKKDEIRKKYCIEFGYDQFNEFNNTKYSEWLELQLISELDQVKNNNKINRTIWIIKLSVIAFGYLILGMFQQTLNPVEFHWVAIIIFFLWAITWINAKTTKKI